MKKLYRNIYKKERGFTIFEFVIIIIIIAILFAIAVPSYIAMRNRTRESATKNEMKNIVTALALYRADNDLYPGELIELEIGYMDNVSEYDFWGNAYQYETDGNSYTLTSYGLNGEIDGGDDIVFEDGVMMKEGAYPIR